ncbi:MAG: GNAT family N-acetyltransferase, partial [Sphingomonadaceae bacterium]|nr:GNAT family N-acetyltransferase [Sphingomonadaceae bacterium]
AAAAGLAWIDAALAPPETVAIIDAGNTVSIRVAEKCGFLAPEKAVYRGESILLFRRPRKRAQEAA